MKRGGRLNCILIAVATLAAVVAVYICVQIANHSKAPVYHVNLAQNPGFESLTDAGNPASWQEDMWLWEEGVSELSVSKEAFSGENSLLVENFGENDARFVQSIAVEPDAWYHITCMVRAEDCGEEQSGAGVSVLDCLATSAYVYDTDGQWQAVELYGKTGEDQHSIRVALRVGGYGSLNMGRAWFDDISVCRVQSVPDEWSGITLSASDTTSSETAESESTDPWMIWGILLVVLVYSVAALLVMKQGRIQGELVKGTRHQTMFCAVLGAALVLRVVIAMIVPGYSVDMNCFGAWSHRLTEVGVGGFYDESVFCDYPPGYMWVLLAVGQVRNFLGVSVSSPAGWLLIKMVPILCDLLCAVILYIYTRKRLGESAALTLAAFCAFNPTMILDSAAWGQIDSVLILLLVVAMLEAQKGRWVRAIPVYFVAVLVKPQALLLGPVALGMLMADIALSRDQGKTAVRMVVAIVAGVLAAAVVALPFVWNETTQGLPKGLQGIAWLFRLYGGTLGQYNYVTINACNLYQLLGLNWVEIASEPVLEWVNWAVYVFAFGTAIAFYAIARKRTGKRNQIFLVSAYALTVIFCFALKMHERYLVPALLMMAIAYVNDRDARILYAGILCTAGSFVNCTLVLINDHLIPALAIFNSVASVLNLVGAMLLVWACADLCLTGRSIMLKARTLDDEAAGKESFQRRMPIREDSRLHMTRWDAIAMVALTLVYSVTAFWNLGATDAPESYMRSSAAGESVVFELEDVSEFHMTYYGGICNSTFTVEFSEDGQNWSQPHSAMYAQSQVFRWLWYTPGEYENGEFVQLESGYPTQTAKFIRITFEKTGMVLFEVAFLDAAGTPIPVIGVSSTGGSEERAMDPSALTDEQNTVPAYPSYYNSTYFDEIYYARTGYELINDLNVYETTHPPLGKVFIMWGMQLFGVNPFGWRFMGTLFGCMMVPLMYLLVKQLIKRTDMAILGTALIALDCMHFTQTRICTIDSYAVFFIMLMYLFMFRYCQMSFHFDKLWKTLVPLALCGVSMGLGIASKWICVYAAVGLAVLFFYTMVKRYLEYQGAIQSKFLGSSQFVRDYWGNLVITLLWCVVWFIIVPIVIYYVSYYPYLSITDQFNLPSVWQEQLNMFDYHSGLINDDHYYQSNWYSWPLIGKPMWFYDGHEFSEPGWTSSISCMGNPAVWWAGLAALIFVAVQLIRGKGDKSYLYIVIGFLAQFLPWTLVERSTFIYHYFASVPFIILAVVMWFDWVRRREYSWYKPVFYGYLAVTLAMFVFFYPVASGTPMPLWWAEHIRWFGWQNYHYW